MNVTRIAVFSLFVFSFIFSKIFSQPWLKTSSARRLRWRFPGRYLFKSLTVRISRLTKILLDSKGTTNHRNGSIQMNGPGIFWCKVP